MSNTITLNLDTLSAHSLNNLSLLLLAESHEYHHLAAGAPEPRDEPLIRIGDDLGRQAQNVTEVRDRKIDEQRQSRERTNAAIKMARERAQARRDAECCTNLKP